jgi:glycosyltransferase involved in cell wall biosynthesis
MQNSQLHTSAFVEAASSTADILVISRVFPPAVGGIEEYAYNRCQQDPDRVIVLTASGCGPQEEAFDLAQAFPVHRWPMPMELGSVGKLGSLLKQLINMTGSFMMAIQLYGRYRYRYIEWCHGYDFPALLLLSYVLPIRFFVYLHGNDVLCPAKNSILRKLFEWTLSRAEGVACNSSFTRNYLKEHFQCDTPTYVITPTVRPEKFVSRDLLAQAPVLRAEVRAKYNIPQDALVILSVGRLVRRKGFNRVIENLPKLLAEKLNIYYLICGRGPLEAELQSLANQLGVQERVIFAGYVPDEQLASYYATCDLFSMLTFFDAEDKSIEGFGIVYLEAGYFAKPVIASRVGGVEDAVHDQVTGLLVDPQDDQEITRTLLQLCTDHPLRERLGLDGQVLANRKIPHRILYTDQVTSSLR